MDDIAMIVAVGTGATFVCLFGLIKSKAVRKFLAFLLIMGIIAVIISLASR